MSPKKEALIVTSATWLVALSLFAGLVACGKKTEKTPAPEPVAAPVAPAMSEEQQFSAMLRGHPNSKRVCIDAERRNAYFLDYGPLPPPGTPDDGKWHGWLFIDNVEFYRTSNNTYFITNQDDKKYVQVYPDVNGLQCRAQ